MSAFLVYTAAVAVVLLPSTALFVFVRVLTRIFSQTAVAGAVTIIFIISSALLSVSSIVWTRGCGNRGCPTNENVKACVAGPAIKIVDTTGAVLGRLQNETWQALPESLPTHVLNAFVDIEDRRFWKHDGVDPIGLARAVIRDIAHLRFREGFSTIDMQIAKLQFLSDLADSSITERLYKKFLEMVVAAHLEKVATKKALLRCYLSIAPFGGRTIGLEAASERIFKKPANRLWLAEAAELAAVVNAPSLLDPRRAQNANRLRTRRNHVLTAMLAVRDIQKEQYAAASARPQLIRSGAPLYEELPAPEARDCLGELVRRKIDSLRFGPNVGEVEVTIGASAQASAIAAMKNEARAIMLSGERMQPDGAFIAVRPSTGAIVAVSCSFSRDGGGPSIYVARPGGSIAKTFVLGAAIEAGANQDTPVQDYPITVQMPTGVTWTPRNMHNQYDGTTSIAHAFAMSRNSAFVRLADDISPGTVSVFAKRLGITTQLKPTPMIALGVDNYKPIDMARVMAAIANDGVQPREVWFIRRVFARDGHVLYEHHQAEGMRVVDSATAAMMQLIMTRTVDSGTASVIRSQGVLGRIGGKTGTSSNATDVWFAGFANDVALAAWFGYPRGLYTLGDEVTSRFAAAAAGNFLLRTATR